MYVDHFPRAFTVNLKSSAVCCLLQPLAHELGRHLGVAHHHLQVVKEAPEKIEEQWIRHHEARDYIRGLFQVLYKEVYKTFSKPEVARLVLDALRMRAKGVPLDIQHAHGSTTQYTWRRFFEIQQRDKPLVGCVLSFSMGIEPGISYVDELPAWLEHPRHRSHRRWQIAHPNAVQDRQTKDSVYGGVGLVA
jgi:hypothetical protein